MWNDTMCTSYGIQYKSLAPPVSNSCGDCLNGQSQLSAQLRQQSAANKMFEIDNICAT